MKLTNHAWILWGIVLAVVLVLSIVIPFAHTATYWLALVCMLAMFGVCAAAFIRAFRKEATLESKLLGWPIFKVGSTVLMVQIVASFILMTLAVLLPVWIAILMEVILFAVTAFSMTVKDAAREAVTQSEKRATDQTAAWKAIRAKANAIAVSSGHPELKKLAEAIRYADPMPTSMDGEIAQMLELLSSYADAENIIKANNLLARRQAISKEEKR